MTQTLHIDQSEVKSAIEILKKHNSTYKRFKYFVQFKINGVNINIYNSGSIVFQGKAVPDNLFGIINLIDSNDFIGIGIDESGKGDIFGGIVVAAAFVKKKNYNVLKKKLIIDSKKLNDIKIVQIYKDIIDLIDVEVVDLMPYEFNNKYKQYNNINRLLADLFYHVGNKLANKTKEKTIICDQFSISKQLLSQKFQGFNLIQEHHADGKYRPVSIASIIARYFFINQLQKLKQQYPMVKFLKGASFDRQIIFDFIKYYGKKELIKVSKINFKTIKIIMNGKQN